MTYQIFPGCALYFTCIQPDNVLSGSLGAFLFSNKNLYLLTCLHNVPLNNSKSGTVTTISCSNGTAPKPVIDQLNGRNAGNIIRSPSLSACDAAVVDISRIKAQLVEENFSIGGVKANGYLADTDTVQKGDQVKLWNWKNNPSAQGIFSGQVNLVDTNQLQVTMQNSNIVVPGNSGTVVYKDLGGANKLIGILSFAESENAATSFLGPVSSNILKELSAISKQSFSVANWSNRSQWIIT